MIKTFEEFTKINEGLTEDILEGLDLGNEIVETCKKFKKAKGMKNEDLKTVLESILNNIDATFEGENCEDDEDEEKKKKEQQINDEKGKQ